MFSGGPRHQPSRSQVPSPGRWTRSDRNPSRDTHHATVDWSAYAPQTPSGGGLAPTPYRSATPASGQRKKGLTNRGPLQKDGLSEPKPSESGFARTHPTSLNQLHCTSVSATRNPLSLVRRSWGSPTR
jgi:hypothetical protein